MLRQIVTLLFALFLVTPVPVWGKSYSIPEVNFQIQIHPNKSIDVVEARSYSFSGEFTFADRTLVLRPGQKISQIKLSDEQGLVYLQNSSHLPGTFFYTQTDTQFYVKWFYKSSDQTKKFTLSYQVQNAAVRHSDISELYWQIIGDQWNLPQSNISAQVFLPKPDLSNSLQAFAHGPLDGKIFIPTKNQVDFTLAKLPPGQFLEIRVLFPADQLAYPVTGSLSLDQILAQEKNFQSQSKPIPPTPPSFVLIIVLTLAPLLFIAYWLWKWSQMVTTTPLRW